MDSRTEEAYTAVLKVVLEPFGNSYIGSVMTDFEMALRNGVRSVLPHADIHGCLFHYSQVRVWLETSIPINFADTLTFELGNLRVILMKILLHYSLNTSLIFIKSVIVRKKRAHYVGMEVRVWKLVSNFTASRSFFYVWQYLNYQAMRCYWSGVNSEVFAGACWQLQSTCIIVSIVLSPGRRNFLFLKSESFSDLFWWNSILKMLDHYVIFGYSFSVMTQLKKIYDTF